MVLSIIGSVIMAIAPVVPYMQQMRQTQQLRYSGGFSPHVSMILLFANIMRLFFWIGARFEIALLVQSVLMIFVQLLLVNTVIITRKVEDANDLVKRKRFQDFDWSYFWNWRDLVDYVLCLMLFTLLVAALSALCINQGWFVTLLGYCALGTEALMAVPQLVRNHTQRSVYGLSLVLVGGWFVGDFIKTLYYIVTRAPIQFTLCGGFQLLVDCLILQQIVQYRTKKFEEYGGSGHTKSGDTEQLE